LQNRRQSHQALEQLFVGETHKPQIRSRVSLALRLVRQSIRRCEIGDIKHGIRPTATKNHNDHNYSPIAAAAAAAAAAGNDAVTVAMANRHHPCSSS